MGPKAKSSVPLHAWQQAGISRAGWHHQFLFVSQPALPRPLQHAGFAPARTGGQHGAFLLQPYSVHMLAGCVINEPAAHLSLLRIGQNIVRLAHFLELLSRLRLLLSGVLILRRQTVSGGQGLTACSASAQPRPRQSATEHTAMATAAPHRVILDGQLSICFLQLVLCGVPLHAQNLQRRGRTAGLVWYAGGGRAAAAAAAPCAPSVCAPLGPAVQRSQAVTL